VNCPLGHGELRTETHSGVDVQACAVCGGEWLHHDDLQTIEKAVVTDAVVLSGMVEYQPHETERRCPVCDRAMYEFDYRGNPLEIDACANGHGYWLDGGEEARVKDFILQRAHDLHRAASAEASFGSFLSGMRSQFGGRGRGRGLRF
jgi:Zn-finger nucleic acid-binding protein